MNDDPRIELPKVGVGIRTRGVCRRRGLRARCRDERAAARGAEAHDEQARVLEQIPAGCRQAPLFQHFFDLFRNVCEGFHAATSFSEAGRAPAITFAARLMAA